MGTLRLDEHHLRALPNSALQLTSPFLTFGPRSWARKTSGGRISEVSQAVPLSTSRR